VAIGSILACAIAYKELTNSFSRSGGVSFPLFALPFSTRTSVVLVLVGAPRPVAYACVLPVITDSFARITLGSSFRGSCSFVLAVLALAAALAFSFSCGNGLNLLMDRGSSGGDVCLYF
jgi:hypothetical protein